MADDKPVYRLLLLEDDPAHAALVRTILLADPDATFEIEVAEKLFAGYAALERAPFDLLLIDYYLPDGNGITFLQEAKARGCTAPAIMITGQGDEHVAVQAIKAGACEYVIKDELVSTLLGKLIQQAVERHRLEQERARAQEQEREEMERALAAQRRLIERLAASPSAPSPSPVSAAERAADHAQLQRQYLDMLRSALEAPIPGELVETVVQALGALHYTTQEVANLHQTAMDEVIAPLPPAQVNIALTEGRLLLAEVLGRLAEVYRQSIEMGNSP